MTTTLDFATGLQTEAWKNESNGIDSELQTLETRKAALEAKERKWKDADWREWETLNRQVNERRARLAQVQ
jgi:hypothetical protein